LDENGLPLNPSRTLKSPAGHDSDSESISAQRSNNTSAMHSYDNHTSLKKHGPPKSCLDKKNQALDNTVQFEQEKQMHMRTLNQFMLLYKNYMSDKQDQLIQIFFMSLIQTIRTGHNVQNDPQYLILNRIETTIQKEMAAKANAEKIAVESNQPVQFKPCS
jgi:hypothetical protein